MAEEDDANENKTKLSKAEEESKNKEYNTDYNAEAEGDLNKAQAALTLLSSAEASATSKASEFAGVLSPQDVAVVMEECDLTKEMAERLLRKNNGVLKDSLTSYIRG